MIVKDESHVIVETLRNIYGYIPFDYYVISDTGSSDNTKDLIRTFFDQKGVSGEIYDDEWKDFGHNRSQAFKHAYKKSDYVFVWDADDRIKGDFKLPTVLEADSYSFSFGQYSRRQLFNNHKLWKYVGVLHEYPACTESSGPDIQVQGSYHFESNRTGSRNKDPLKYLKDGQVLEKAFYEAQEAKDPIHERYAYYCANSYNSTATHKDKAIEFYKKVLTLNNWNQEKYNSCIALFEIHESMQKTHEALHWLVESHKYDATRIEGIYRLVKHYCINGQPEVAMAYYTLVQNYYENHFLQDNIAKKLFVKRAEYEFFFPYYMIIVSERVKNRKVGAKCYEIIFERQHVANDWWIKNLFTNLQFFLDQLPTGSLPFCRNFMAYVDRCGACLDLGHHKTIGKILDRCRPVLGAPPVPNHPVLKHVNRPKPTILLSVTTCKRWDLFEKTVNSILKCWTDLDKVDYFLCVDDNSSEADRTAMATTFPFFEYVLKGPEQRGHRESMNIIWNKLQELRPTYWIHMEDDWLFFKRTDYITRAAAALDKYKDHKFHQLVFNKNYGVVYNDLERTGGRALDPGLHLHIKIDEQPGRHSGYWPHYSLQPSMTLTETVLALGNYDSPNKFFERDYADKWFAKGYQTMFFDSMYSIHIGKQHWEKEGKNAYALNDEAQFNNQSTVTKAINEIINPIKPIQQWTPIPYPCPTGSMAEHLKTFQALIDRQQPFALIRPSDGEHSVLKNRTLTNCDKWTFKEGGQLQKDLLAAVQTDVSGLYIGIPCNTCQMPWNCTNEVYHDYMDLIPQHRRTYANLFMNANWPAFIEHLKAVKQPIHVITSGSYESADLTFASRHLIDPLLVDKWDEKGVAETARILDYVKGKRGAIICFSAGPLSKVWIPKCWAINPTNIYLDVGATLDLFTKGPEVKSRFYTDRNHLFAKKACVFREPIKGKYLVYLCVFYNKAYIELLQILMASIHLFTSMDKIDLLIFTSPEFEKDIQAISTQCKIPVQIKLFTFKTFLESACARLHIYEYKDIHLYEKIMYIDTDILLQNDLGPLLAEPLENKIYALEEGTIEHEYHGGWYFDFTTINKNLPGFNSGILLFPNTDKIRGLLNACIQHIAAAGSSIPACYDQPFLNYQFVKTNSYDVTLMKKYALIYAMDPPPPPSSPTSIALCHFVWPIGNASHKLNRMKSHITHLLKNYKTLYPSADPIDTSSCLYKTYTWGTHGFIEFQENGILRTAWQQGTYQWTSPHTVTVSWSGYHHHMLLNGNTALSIRQGDCTIGEHVCYSSHVKSPIKSTRSLLYMSVFYNKDYFKLLNLLLSSLQFYSFPLNYDILILTSEEFRPLVIELTNQHTIPLLVHTIPANTIFEAACARLCIFNYTHVYQYTKILYLDTDILIKGELDTLFQLPLEDKLYALESGTTESVNFGVQFFQPPRNVSGFNSGTLLFPNSPALRSLFQRIQQHIRDYTQSKATPPYALDQPFINYHAIKESLYDNQTLKPYVALFEGHDSPPQEASAIVCHFSFPIGNFGHKYNRMRAYFQKILSIKTDRRASIQGKYLLWDLGFVHFVNDTDVHTKWGPGKYTFLDTHRVYVIWNNHHHVIQFYESNNTYSCVRIHPNDFLVCNGPIMSV